MRTVFVAVSAALLACICAGCAVFLQNSDYDTYERLLRLYQAGKIDAQQLTSRQHEIALREQYARDHPEPVSDSSSSADTTTTTDDKCKDDRKKNEPTKPPDPHCPRSPGRH